MTWLLFVALQPVAFELYRWAPLLDDDAQMARLLVREVTLCGPVLVLMLLAPVPVEHADDRHNAFRFMAWLPAIGLLFLALHLGIENNAPYRLAYFAQQLLVVGAWWCAIVGERPRAKLDHCARLAGLLWASLGAGFCLGVNIVWPGALSGVMELYDPFLDTPSRAGALGLHHVTWLQVLGSLASVAVIWRIIKACERGETWARRIGARAMRVGWRM